MKIISFGEKLDEPIVLCLGYFGCMHKGHVKLLEVAKKHAKVLNAKVALFTFTNNHLKVLGKDISVVYTCKERSQIYESLGIDYVIGAEFDDNFRKMRGREYLSKLCLYDLKGVVCGFDHHCGSDRLGASEIQKYFSKICNVEIVEQISVNKEKVSTTLVRRLLTENNILAANELLSEPFFITGKVMHGRGIGKTLGFPTANVNVDSDKLLPYGVFGGIAKIEGEEKLYRCIVNIGQTPTFDITRVAIEAHLLNFEGDLYDKNIKLSLTKYLRQINKFNSVDELSRQLQNDKERVLND